MGLFDIFKKKNVYSKVEELASKEYKQEYLEECKYIWQQYVPKKGQASNLRGELLREIEKIRCEAQDNGNINWDNDFTYFCDFISKKLSEQSIFLVEEKEEINLIMSYLKDFGIYAQKFYSGEISEKDVDMNKIAYVDDNLYNIICDKIGKLQKENPEPIPYEINNNIKR